MISFFNIHLDIMYNKINNNKCQLILTLYIALVLEGVTHMAKPKVINHPSGLPKKQLATWDETLDCKGGIGQGKLY